MNEIVERHRLEREKEAQMADISFDNEEEQLGTLPWLIDTAAKNL